jgi:hypothetical protein
MAAALICEVRMALAPLQGSEMMYTNTFTAFIQVVFAGCKTKCCFCEKH